MRKYDISCTIILQTVSQLKARYKDDYETIIGNSDSFLFLGGQEQSTLELVSKKLGKETIKVRNTSKNIGSSRQRGGNISDNKAGRELMTPDEIAKMDTSECIYFLRGENPFFGKKYNYPKHPNYHLTGDADDRYLYDVHDYRRTYGDDGYAEKEEYEGNAEEEEIPETAGEDRDIVSLEKTDETDFEISEAEEVPEFDISTIDTPDMVNESDEW